MENGDTLVRWLDEVRAGDVAEVGGKNASLGEMLSALGRVGIDVPPGFAVTAAAYRLFLAENRLEEPIAHHLSAYRSGGFPLHVVGEEVRHLISRAALPSPVMHAVRRFYGEFGQRIGRVAPDVAVRSSATAEDLPEASFAGQQETFLNVRGEEALLDACRRCYASLFTDRAIAYREAHGFEHLRVALSIGVQKMVRSDKACAGVMFTIDPETGFPRTVLINGAWGLGETVVQGTVDPDEFVVFKPLLDRPDCVPIISRSPGDKRHKLVYGAGGHTRLEPTGANERGQAVLSDTEVLALARWGVEVERHFHRPMDLEWAKDGETGRLYIVQARPETVQSRREAGALRSFRVSGTGPVLAEGIAVGEAAAVGKACRLASPAESDRFPTGAILVAAATDPDWVPVMKRAAAIVTDHGGRTSHAAIVSRELGVPAVVGTGTATAAVEDGRMITVSCAEGDIGFVTDGAATVESAELDLGSIPPTQTKVMLNLANPAAALRWWRLPADGVGLARMEFIIANLIRIHPMALVHFDRLDDPAAKARITHLTRGYADKAAFFVDRLVDGVARIAAAHHPNPVIVRMSDFKTNEYAALIGGAAFEPKEENPMIGWRGACRYYGEGYRQGFALECRAIRRVRSAMGLGNVVVMIPFCRTPGEADRVLAVMAENGLVRGEDGLEVYVMCEIPSNVILAHRFAERFDGFSIGSNDLTQLTLGVDRESEILAPLFDEEDEAVTTSIQAVIERAHVHGRKVGFCGQAPSNRPSYAALLVDAGIDSISVTPDSFLAVKSRVAEAEDDQDDDGC
ncbi:MAG: phosphoenolpyruvate synthase [Magnetospirillum sp.]|nr:MAG: phosphoenolpyruvate synthase [Magnetospirillum sp.]